MNDLSLLEKIFIILQHLVPQHSLSRLIGLLAESENRAIKNFLIRHFIKQFKVDMTIAASPEITSYKNFNAFFTRPLKEGVRIIDNSCTLCSPVDGKVSEAGQIHDNKLIQAKGFNYNLQNLLGGDNDLATHFIDGNFATIYLSPKDYHRIHMPCDGKLIATRYVPGKLFSVNDATAQSVPSLFARNERLVCLFETAQGPMVMILVGAMIVAGIETVWSGQVAPQTKISTTQHHNKTITLSKGEEMGRFKLGSTVILLTPKQATPFNLEKNATVVLGQAISS